MLGIYFSGTGNSKYVLEVFLNKLDSSSSICAIENKNVFEFIAQNDEIVFSYSVQFSNIPKMMKDFIDNNQQLWKNKKIFVTPTMGLFSGDGAGILGRRLKKYGAEIIGGLHLRMPDTIADAKVLKHSLEKNKELVRRAEDKIERAVYRIQNGKMPREGMGPLYHFAGLFGQRLYFYGKTRKYTDKLKIDLQKCIGCGGCAELCPMKNISMESKLPHAGDQCTMCYRCVNVCPVQAVTLLGKHVTQQWTITNYLNDL